MRETMQTHTDNTRVLIVGAGPAGLTAAIELSRLGIETTLVERRPELSSLPRATAISLRSMELIRSWGVEDAVRAGSIDVEWTGWQAPSLKAIDEGNPWPLGIPTPEQCAVLSPTSPACVPQDHLEPVLLDHLRTYEGACIHLGTEVTGLEQTPEGAEVELRHLATGETHTVHADYVVAADGAHSRIRKSLGVEMIGPDGLAHVVTAVFRAPIWDVVGERRYGIYSVDGGTLLPAGPSDRWVYGKFVAPDEMEGYPQERIVAGIREGAGVPDLPVSIERAGAFTFAAQLADRFREGNVFLVGDAAHRVTPRGGTGMNTAIGSAYDLGWKLGWVLNGWADAELLDTYEAERRPVAAHNVARSADVNGSVRDAVDELHVDLGGRIPHVWIPYEGERVSTLDLMGPGLTVFAGPGADVTVPDGNGPPVTVRELDEMGARALGIRGCDTLVVRPDGTRAAVVSRAGSSASSERYELDFLPPLRPAAFF
jgi:2-polyprenyl-6-methoxyphenol hydroxylase-like FAD-dependent oxidoreductase